MEWKSLGLRIALIEPRSRSVQAWNRGSRLKYSSTGTVSAGGPKNTNSTGAILVQARKLMMKFNVQTPHAVSGYRTWGIPSANFCARSTMGRIRFSYSAKATTKSSGKRVSAPARL